MMILRKAFDRRAFTRPAGIIVIPILDACAVAGASHIAGLRGGAEVAFLAATTFLLSFSWLNHRKRVNPSVGEDLRSIIGTIAVAALAAGLVVEARILGDLIRAAAVAAGLVPAGRIVSYAVVRVMRARGLSAEPTIIVGAGELGTTLAQTISRHPEYGFQLVGFVDEAAFGLEAPLLGAARDLRRIVEAHGIRRVIVAYGSARDAELVPSLRDCDELPLEIFVVQRLHELAVDGDRGEEIWGFPVARLARGPFRRPAWRLKRAVDIGVASVALLLSAPLLALTALAVRSAGPGPILFRQTRVGRNGKTIEIAKFRTLKVNDDSDTTWSVADDERRTTVGRVLRKTHLDELPQLISILRGDMSLVGPRPERPFFVEDFSKQVTRYADRHRVTVGLTGWAQVHGLNGDTSIVERARFDNRYIERWSLWRDMITLVRTVGAIGRSLVSREDEEAPPATAEISTEAPLSEPDRVIDLREAEIPVPGHNGSNGNGHKPRRRRLDPTRRS